MSVFGNNGLSLGGLQLENSGYVHKRAYCKISRVGGGKASCAGGITSIESNIQVTHSELMGTEGGRLTPAPVLESFDLANDGGQDPSDAMLFEANAKIKVFSLADLNSMDNSFLVPGQRINISLGWVGGTSEKIEAEIVGYDFSINQDGSFDLNIKAGGKLDGVVETDFFTLSQSKPFAYTDPESKKEVVPSDIIGNIIGEATEKLKSVSPGDGKAQTVGAFANVNHQMERKGFFSMFSSNDNVVSYVAAKYIVDSINKNINPKLNLKSPLFSDAHLFVEGTKKSISSEIQSPDPLSAILTNGPKYGPNADYSGVKKYKSGILGEIFISIPALAKIQEDLTNPPGSDSKKSAATIDYLKKIFQLINDCTGGYCRPYIYSDPNSSKTGRGEQMLIINKGSDFGGNSATTISVLDGFDQGVRSFNIQSNLDSDMMAMALHAAQTGKGGASLKKIFPGCFDNLTSPKDETDFKGDKDKAFELLGDTISQEDITKAKQSLKAYVEAGSKKTQPVVKYNIECSFKSDGFFGARFGDAFKLDRLPATLKNNAYFIVSKIGHEFSNGDWTTEITGIMMLKA